MIMWSVRLSHSGSMTFSRHWMRAVGGGAGAAGLELRGRGQQVHRAVGIQVFGLARHGGHRRRGATGYGIDHHQQVELVHGPLHLQAARLRVGRMAPIEHAAQVAVLIDEFVFLQHTVDPARHRDAGLAHHARAA